MRRPHYILNCTCIASTSMVKDNRQIDIQTYFIIAASAVLELKIFDGHTDRQRNMHIGRQIKWCTLLMQVCESA